MSEPSLRLIICRETKEILEIRVMKPGRSRHTKVYDKASLELSGFRAEVVLKDPSR